MIALDQRRALVCGSSRGIGRACAVELARQGAAVTLVARTKSLLGEVAASLSTEAGQRHDFFCADFAEPAVLGREVARRVAQDGAYHILVNNTGGPPAGPILKAGPEEFTAAFLKHLICSQLLVQTVVPGMREARYGRIINIISISVKAPIENLGVSNATRGAMASWAKTLAGELAPFGITVNNVLPGYTATERMAELIEWKAAQGGVTAAEVEAQMKAEVPAGRFADPAETAAAVGFLASPAAGYINGINLPVDGGRLPTL